MKFAYGLPLLSVATLGRNNTNNAKSQSCAGKLDCLIQDLMSKDPQFASKVRECQKKPDQIRQLRCIYVAGGMRSDQVDSIIKYYEVTLECTATAKDLMEECLSNCSQKDGLSCQGKCNASLEEDALNCVYKKANVSNYDFSSGMMCIESCHQTNMPDMFDCLYKCNEPIFNGLGGQVQVSDSKDTEKPKDSKKDDDKKSEDKKGAEGSKDAEKPKDDKKSDHGSKDSNKPPSSNANQVQFEKLSLVALVLSFSYFLSN